MLKDEETKTAEEEETPENADEQPEDPDNQPGSGEGGEDPDEPEDPNKEDKSDSEYETELERERQRAEKAERALAQQSFSERKKKREDKDEDEEEGKPLTIEQLNRALDERDQRVLKQTQHLLIQEKVKKLTNSESEARLILEIHKNRQWPNSIPLEEQLEEAQAIANRRKVKAREEELKRALKNRDGASGDPAQTRREAPPQKQPKLSSNDAAVLKGAGFEWDGNKGMWKKLLPNKQYLYRDPKTGKVFKQ